MLRRSSDLILAFIGGTLLAVMVSLNSLLAKNSTPALASWVAHGVGSVFAMVLILVFPRVLPQLFQLGGVPQKSPAWVYLGGVLGAIGVLLTSVTVNSALGLSGSVALVLVGQVVFGILSDQFGLFGAPRRKFGLSDVLVVLSVLGGSGILIFFGR